MLVKFKKHIALILAVCMLLSSTGVYGFTHVCKCTGAVESFIFYSTHSKCCKQDLKIKNCCSEKIQKKESDSPEKCQPGGKKCCDTTLKYFQMDADLVNFEYEFNFPLSFEYLKKVVPNNFYNFPNLPIESDTILKLSYCPALFHAQLPCLSVSENIQLLQSIRC